MIITFSVELKGIIKQKVETKKQFAQRVHIKFEEIERRCENIVFIGENPNGEQVKNMASFCQELSEHYQLSNVKPVLKAGKDLSVVTMMNKKSQTKVHNYHVDELVKLAIQIIPDFETSPLVILSVLDALSILKEERQKKEEELQLKSFTEKIHQLQLEGIKDSTCFIAMKDSKNRFAIACRESKKVIMFGEGGTKTIKEIVINAKDSKTIDIVYIKKYDSYFLHDGDDNNSILKVKETGEIETIRKMGNKKATFYGHTLTTYQSMLFVNSGAAIHVLDEIESEKNHKYQEVLCNLNDSSIAGLVLLDDQTIVYLTRNGFLSIYEFGGKQRGEIQAFRLPSPENKEFQVITKTSNNTQLVVNAYNKEKEKTTIYWFTINIDGKCYNLELKDEKDFENYLFISGFITAPNKVQMYYTLEFKKESTLHSLILKNNTITKFREPRIAFQGDYVYKIETLDHSIVCVDRQGNMKSCSIH